MPESIYFFEPQLQNIMLKKIHASLKIEGILVLGTAETKKDEILFSYISSQKQNFKKIIF